MNVFRLIPNGLEFLDITSPSFDKSHFEKNLKSNTECYYFVESYVADMYLEQLKHPGLKGKVVLTSDCLTYFTTSGVRDRFANAVSAIKSLNKPNFVIHYEELNNETTEDTSKIGKMGRAAVKMVKPILNNVDTVVIDVPKRSLIVVQAFVGAIISLLPSSKLSFMIQPTSEDQAVEQLMFLKGVYDFMTDEKSKLFVKSAIDVKQIISDKGIKFLGEFVVCTDVANKITCKDS